MKVIAIYPGRFQPFGPHHKKTMEWLQNQFGRSNTFITTSNKVNSKSPLNFDEKKSIIAKSGIPRSQIVQVKSPYRSEELLKTFNADNTAVVMIYGEKDANRISFTKKDGSPGYFQDYESNKNNLQPFSKHAYIITAPHISINIPGFGEMSGTKLRQFIPSATPEEFDRVFGWYDIGLHDMLSQKFSQTNESLSEKKGHILNVFDFDDTLAKTDASIKVIHSNGSTQTLTPAEYAKYVPKKGDKFDFAEFGKIIKSASPIKDNIKKLMRSLKTHVGRTTILTARALGYPVKHYLKDKFGLDVYVVPLASGDPKKKADWIKSQIKRGIKIVNFYDDSIKNIKAVSKLQQEFPEVIINSKLVNELNEVSVSTGNSSVDDGPRFMYGDVKSYKNSMKDPAKMHPDWEIIDWIINNIEELPIYDTDWPDGPVPGVSFFPAGVGNAGTDYFLDTQNSIAFSNWKSHVANGIGSNNKVVNYLDADLSLNNKVVREHIHENISRSELKNIERFADELFAELGIDIVFTRHFYERLNHPRNKTPITSDELKDIFNDVFKKYGEKLDDNINVDAIIKSLSTKINLPFIMQWDDNNKEFDLVAKTIMRKNNFLTNDKPFVVETIKKVGDKWVVYPKKGGKRLGTHSTKEKALAQLRAIEINKNEEIQQGFMKQGLIMEGGAFGHMSHPIDNPSFTFNDLITLVDRSLKGELDIEGPVQEKLDGQNLMVTYKDGKLGAARNKSTILNPMSLQDVASKFAGRGNITTAFVEAMRDLQTALKNIPEDTLNTLFKNGQRFLNMEILFPGTRNVIDYGQAAYLVLLGMVEFDENAKPVKNMPQIANQLQKVIEKINASQQDTFSIIAPKVLKLAATDDFDKKSSEFKSRLSKIANSAGLSTNATIGDYTDSMIGRVIDSKFNISDELRDALIARWSRGDKSVRLTRSVFGDEFEKIREFDRNELKSLYKKIKAPLESVMLELGLEVLSNINDFLTAAPNETIVQIKKRIQSLIKKAKGSKDPAVLDAVTAHLTKLQNLGGFKNIVPAEGIVFNYKGNLMKFTGTFQPINQLLGIFRFKR